MSTRVAELVAEVEAVITAAGLPDARAEARDLLAAMLDKPRFWATLNASGELDAEVARRIRAAAARRATGMPFAYAAGRAAFRYLTLAVDERVLIPRQETEVLVDHVLRELGDSRGVAVDVGTGSGAIALALASEASLSKVIATDVSSDALAVATSNAERLRDVLKAAVEFRQGNGLEPLRGERVDAVISNPPYIAFDEAADLPASVRNWEPTLALLSAENGLSTTTAIVREAVDILVPGGLLALEIDSRRGDATAAIVRATGAYDDVRVLPDLAGRDRVLLARRRG